MQRRKKNSVRGFPSASLPANESLFQSLSLSYHQNHTVSIANSIQASIKHSFTLSLFTFLLAKSHPLAFHFTQRCAIHSEPVCACEPSLEQ